MKLGNRADLIHKLSVVFLISKSEIGGAQRWVKQQIDHLSSLNRSVKIYLFTDSPGWLTENTQAECIFIDTLSQPSIRATFFVIRCLEKVSPNLVVCNSSYAGCYGRIGSSFLGIPAIFVTHGWGAVYNSTPFSAFLFRQIERSLSLITAVILCVSEHDKKVAIEMGIKPCKLKVVRNYALATQDSHFTGRFSLNHDVVHFLSVGRLKKPKQFKLLVNSFPSSEHIHLHIVGDGPDKEELKAALKKRRVKNITLHGEILDFHDFQLFDCFILVSESEGLPMSALEAKSNGVPLLLSNVGGCPELIDNDTNGYTFTNHSQEIEIAINKFIINAKRLKSNAKAFDSIQESSLLQKQLLAIYIQNAKL